MNIHILPTDQPSRLVKNNEGKLKLTIQTLPFDNIIWCYPQSVYITSDEEIKKDEYYLGDDNYIYNLVTSVNNNGKKIVLTTNTELIADGVQAIDDEFLEWFIENPSCEFVETELLGVSEVLWEEYFNKYGVYPKYPYYEKIIIPQEEPKQELNEISLSEPLKTWDDTLEAAAEQFANKEDLTWENTYAKEAFIAGAKYQAEKMYEDDMIRFMQYIISNPELANTGSVSKDTAKYYLDQFKNNI